MNKTQQHIRRAESAGGVVLNRKGRVLVVNQGGRSWSLPKGHIDPGESPLEAAMREITEESGISKLTLIRPLGSYQRFKIGFDGGEDKREQKTIHLFLFTTDEEALAPQDANNPEARWVEKNNVEGLLTHPKDKAVFLDILKDL